MNYSPIRDEEDCVEVTDETYSFVNTRSRGNRKNLTETNSNLDDSVEVSRESCVQFQNVNVSPPLLIPNRNSRIVISGEITSLGSEKIELYPRNDGSSRNVSERYSFHLREQKKEKPTITSNINEQLNCQKNRDFNNSNGNNNYSEAQTENNAENNTETDNENFDSTNSSLEDSNEILEEVAEIMARRLEHLQQDLTDSVKLQSLIRKLQKKENLDPKMRLSSSTPENKNPDNCLKIQEELNCQKNFNHNDSSKKFNEIFTNVHKIGDLLKNNEKTYDMLLKRVESTKKILNQDMRNYERLWLIQESWEKMENHNLPSVSQNKCPGQSSTADLFHPEERKVPGIAEDKLKFEANSKNVDRIACPTLIDQKCQFACSMIQDDESTLEITIKIDAP